MAATVYPVTPSFAAEIGDVDLSAPIEPSDLAAVKEAFATYAVLIFPDQHLSQDQHLDFARHFGPLETTIGVYRKDAPLRVRQEFADVSNLNHNNEMWGKDSRVRLFQLGNRLWHTDSSFKRLPARASLLYARSIPPVGGHTEFADERAAYDALPEEMKRRLHRSWPSTRSSIRARGSASPISPRRSAGKCRRSRRWSCAPFPNPAANRFISRRMRAGSSACPSPKAAC